MPKKSKKETVESKKSKVKKTTKTKAPKARQGLPLSAKATAKTNVVVKIDQRKTTTARKPAAPQQKAPSTVVIQGSAPQPIYPMYNQMFPATAAAQQPAVQEPVGQKIGIKPSLTKKNLESAAHFSIYPDWETVSSLSDPTFSWKSNSEYPEESSYNLSVPRSSVPSSKGGKSRSTLSQGSAFVSEQSVPTWAKLPSAPSSVASKFSPIQESYISENISDTESSASYPQMTVQEEAQQMPVANIRIGKKVKVRMPVRIPVAESDVMSEKTPSIPSESSSARIARQQQLVTEQYAEEQNFAVQNKLEHYGLTNKELERYALSQGLQMSDAKKRLAQRLRERKVELEATPYAQRPVSLDILKRAEKKTIPKAK